MERLARENRDLAGQVGYFQARAQVLDERVRMLEAPGAGVGALIEAGTRGVQIRNRCGFAAAAGDAAM